jgi:mono/diheme cytochrome c family protein
MLQSRSFLALCAALLLSAACGGSKPPAETAMKEKAPVVTEPVADVVKEAVPETPVVAQVDPKAVAMSAELAAFEKAKPVFTEHCAHCHSKGGAKTTAKKLKEFDMTTYPIGGDYAATIGTMVAKVLGQAGPKATMPIDKRGSVKDAQLASVMEWVKAWEAAEAAGAHAK